MSSCEPPIKGQPAWHATFQLCPGTTLQLCRNTPDVDNLSYVKSNIETQTPALEAPTPVNLSALGNYDQSPAPRVWCDDARQCARQPATGNRARTGVLRTKPPPFVSVHNAARSPSAAD